MKYIVFQKALTHKGKVFEHGSELVGLDDEIMIKKLIKNGRIMEEAKFNDTMKASNALKPEKVKEVEEKLSKVKAENSKLVKENQELKKDLEALKKKG